MSKFNGYARKVDAPADVFKRAMRNPTMIRGWDMLTKQIVENF